MIPDSFKQDLLSRVDVVEIVSRYVRLKKSGANYQGLCPFHAEKTPSFTVSPTKQFYHCFGCGAHGNAIGFLMAYGGLGYVEAVKDLASMTGLQMPEWQPRSGAEAQRQAEQRERQTDLAALMETAMEFYRGELKKSQRAIAYLKGRGLTGEIAARFRVGYAPDDWQALKGCFENYADASLVECGLVIDQEGKRYDRFRDRVVFPILSARGAVVGFGGRVIGQGEPKYLNSPETPLFEKGREIYGLVQARDAIRAAGRVLVVEGYMDVVALAQYGVGYAVATLGTATTPVHVAKLLRLADEVVFAFDGDAAGRKAAWRALEVSLPLATDVKPIRFLFLPEGDDPDSYVRGHGKDAFEQLVREAQTLSEYLIAELRAEFDLSKPEGRAGFLVRSKDYLQRLQAAALRMQLVKEVADLARLSPEEARPILEIRGPAFARPAPPRTAAPIAGSQERNLLRCVLADPALADQLDAALLDPGLAETRALRAIAEFPRRGGVSGALLVEQFQGTEFEQTVFEAQASSLVQDLAGEAASEEFRQIQLALRIKRKNREIDDLTRQVKSNPALSAELNQRVKELHQLKAQRT